MQRAQRHAHVAVMAFMGYYADHGMNWTTSWRALAGARTLLALAEDDLAGGDVALHHPLRQLEPLRLAQVEQDRHLRSRHQLVRHCYTPLPSGHRSI